MHRAGVCDDGGRVVVMTRFGLIVNAAETMVKRVYVLHEHHETADSCADARWMESGAMAPRAVMIGWDA